MKALTISQPYASLIANGNKFVENRTWPTSHRGQLAIHAGKSPQYLSRAEVAKSEQGVIAICELVACYPIAIILSHAETTPGAIACGGYFWLTLRNHNHTEGPYCWILTNVQRVGPHACSGKQRLWEWDA